MLPWYMEALTPGLTMLSHWEMRSDEMIACVVSHVSVYGLFVPIAFAALVKQYHR